MINLQQLLNQAEDIVLLERDAPRNKYRFAFPFVGDLAGGCYDATLALDNSLPEFQGYWKFNILTNRINGSGVFQQARLGRILRPQGLELPDTKDLKELEKQGKLTGRFHRDCGVAVYSDDEPNKKTARALIEKARQEGWELPLLWGFGDLDYKVDNGVQIISVEKPRRVVSGEKAEDALKGFYKGYSGVQMVYRSRYGGDDRGAEWGAERDDFAYSSACSLVDWVCAEGTRENLMEGYNNLLARKYSAKEEQLQRQISELNAKRAKEEKVILEALKA